MVRFISELISNHSVVVKTSDGQQSRLKRINNGVPQGSVLSPLLFNVYIADLPETNSKKYGYADDLALLKVHQDWNTIEETLTQDMSILSSWLKQWRLKLSEAKTVSSTFHLNNREATRELHVNISGRRLTCHRTPTYLGVKLDRTLTYREHLTALRGKAMARTALIRHLAGTSWGASTPTLRTSTLALVYAPAEYCAPVWCRSSHTHLVDVGLNASLRTITGCLRPTPVDQLPVLAEIAPPALRREAATLVLGRRACQHDHLLHDVMENSTHRKRLKSRRPLTHHAHQLVSSVPSQETVKHWTQTRWAESWASTTTRLHRYMPTPSNSGQGVGLSRRAWTRLNRLRTGVGRFGANMLRWGLSTSDCCDCGAEQTAEHITSGRCPIYRPPDGIQGLIELDVMTRTWLENCALDV